jgi:Fe-S-cluster containining protein
MQLSDLKHTLYETMKTHSPRERRELLITEMAELSKKEIHCFQCTGTCCTFAANSMQVTPLEAFEILLSLEVNAENIESIRQTMKENIQHYRLDHEISLGKKAHAHLRKTYTCPFFTPGPKGCSIKKELKPYGCLGFNPRIANDNGGQCHSDFSLLERRENNEISNEELANNYLKREFNITWNKLEIPKALLVLLDKLIV